MISLLPPPRALAFLAAMLASGAARAAVTVEISGGGGTPLSITLLQPVIYTVTAGASYGGFAFDGALSAAVIFSGAGTSTITYSVNGGTAIRASFITTGMAGNEVSGDDLQLFSYDAGPLQAGDVVTLSAGTFVSTANVSATPAGGNSFESFMFDSMMWRISTNAVPEPSAALLLGLGFAGVLLCRRRDGRRIPG